MEVIESYKDYLPSVEVKSVVNKLMTKIPSTYLSGLGNIILTNYSGLPRHRKRSTSSNVLGLYHYETSTSKPWIELFIDNILEHTNDFMINFFSYKSLIIGRILLHEISHHIHRTKIPKHEDVELVAEQWEAKISAQLLFKKYWYIIPFTYMKAIYNHHKDFLSLVILFVTLELFSLVLNYNFNIITVVLHLVNSVVFIWLFIKQFLSEKNILQVILFLYLMSFIFVIELIKTIVDYPTLIYFNMIIIISLSIAIVSTFKELKYY